MAMGQQSPEHRISSPNPRTDGGAEAVLTEHTILTSSHSPYAAIGVPRGTQSPVTHRAPFPLQTFWGSHHSFKARNGQTHPRRTDNQRVRDTP